MSKMHSDIWRLSRVTWAGKVCLAQARLLAGTAAATMTVTAIGPGANGTPRILAGAGDGAPAGTIAPSA